MSSEDTSAQEAQPPPDGTKAAFLGGLAGFLFSYLWGGRLTNLQLVLQFILTLVTVAGVAGIIFLCSTRRWVAGKWFFIALLAFYIAYSCLAFIAPLLPHPPEHGNV